jgi:TonB family protein
MEDLILIHLVLKKLLQQIRIFSPHLIILLFIILFTGCGTSNIPSKDEIEKQNQSAYEKTGYYIYAEEMPEPIGGISMIQSRVVYPDKAKSLKIEGKVIVLAFVDENGSVAKTEILKSDAEELNQSASDAVMKAKFKPGKTNGTSVKVQVAIPIIFRLR